MRFLGPSLDHDDGNGGVDDDDDVEDEDEEEDRGEGVLQQLQFWQEGQPGSEKGSTDLKNHLPDYNNYNFMAK